jgi:hypothetical protein
MPKPFKRPVRQISEERKTLYYIGMGLGIFGFLLFGSVFVTSAMHFGDFTDFEGRAKSEMFRAIGGMAIMILGGVLTAVGSRGLAGSGVLLDPEKAREDLEPYTRMAGGMAKDALDEAGIALGSNPPERVVMVKCQACGKLNQEDAKFCQECGKKM